MAFFDWFERLFRKAAPPPAPVLPPAQEPAPKPAQSEFTFSAIAAPSVPPPTPSPAPKPAAPPPPTPAPARPAANALDAGDFLPITRAEVAEAAREQGSLLRNVWFGRRDLIPPSSDTRTRIIDRAMVGQGMITPEELAEIHRVGDEMERLRPSLDAIHRQAANVGQAAVAADREARAQRKAQKKAEAAAKRQKHAEGVARRRATDIVFLGRGVSSRLGQRQSDVAKLQQLGLPELHTPAQVAEALGLTIPQLRWLAYHTEVATRTHYVRFTVPKKSGGTRTLFAPHKKLKAAQAWVLRNIVDRLPVLASAHGFVRERSILTNAREHTGKSAILNMDLEDFFPSITFRRVRHVFQRHGYSGAVATVLALLCTECPRQQVTYAGKLYEVAVGPRGLPQGAPTSPGLSNQVARKLDKRLIGLAAKMGLTYTRYADDITLSGGDEFRERIGYVMARVRHFAQEEGFTVNEKKSRVMRRNAAQAVTGLVVNDKPSLPRQEIRRLRAILHRARFEGLDAQNRGNLPHFREWLAGKVAYLKMVRPDLGAKMQADLDQLLRQPPTTSA